MHTIHILYALLEIFMSSNVWDPYAFIVIVLKGIFGKANSQGMVFTFLSISLATNILSSV